MPEDGGEPSADAVGTYSSDCGARYSSSEHVIEGLAVGVPLVMVEAHELDGPTDFVERNENGTYTSPSFRVRFDSAITLGGGAWEQDGEIVAIIAGETLYEDRSGKLYEQTPCGATDPTVTHQLLGLDGGPAALMLERFVTEGIYFVRIAFGYDPETETVTLPDGEVSLEELEQQVAAERSERGL